MKPVVTSIVALALAVVPFAASAAPKLSTHVKTEKIEKIEKIEKAAKHTKARKPSLVSVRHGIRTEKSKPVAKASLVRHATGVDVSGSGHEEPSAKVLQPVALKKPAAPAKMMQVSLKLPQLPPPSRTVEKKSDAPVHMTKAQKEMAELVALIRAPVKTEVTPKGNGLEVVVAKVKGEPAPAVKKQCAKEPFEIIRGPEMEKLALTTCDGKIAPLAVEQLSVLVRPGGAARPTTSIKELAKKKSQEIAPGIRRVDERLAIKLQSVVDHFTKDGITPKVSVISGYRPTSTGSMHATGRAVDFRIEGTKNEDVVAFCKTLDDTGCGYYPNSSFVHLDVRDPGHKTSWIDMSGPGETPKYVTAWPPKHEELQTTSAKVAPESRETANAAPVEGESASEETVIN